MVARTSHSSISAFDAKNRLGQLLDRVQAGEELIITRHGEPVARLVPIEKDRADRAAHAIAKLRQIRETIAASGKKVTLAEIATWKSQGRR